MLTGSVLLFAVLSVAMWLTRNIHRPQPRIDQGRKGAAVRPDGRLPFTGPAGMMPRRSGEFYAPASSCLAARLRGHARLRPGAGQRLQLVRLYRRGPAKGLREGQRHQGQLHDLRFQRDPRSQAARRPLGLRRRGADRFAILRAPARRRPLQAARQGQAQEPQEPRSRDHGAARQVRSRQCPRHPLDVGHHGHRLQRRRHQEAHGRRAGRFAEDDLRSRGRVEVRRLRRHGARQRHRRLPGGAEVSRASIPIPRSPRTSPRRPTS